MKKIFTLLTIGLALMSAGANAQAPNWSWAKNAGGSGNDISNGVCVDASGNTYVTGNFTSSSITFGSTTLSNTAAGGLDYFLVKYDASGNVLWAKGASGVSNDGGSKVAVDANGNVYVSGNTNSNTLTFGSTTLALHGYDDTFIVKYDASGNVLWAKIAGGSANDIGLGISLDGSGNAYICGYFASSTMSFGTTSITNAGGNDIFVAKYDASGNVVWAKRVGGTGDDSANGVDVDASGNVFITGTFLSSSISFGTTTLSNGGGIDMFTAKLDASGTAVWAKSATGVSNDVANGVKMDPSGNAIVIGTFNSSTLTFGSFPLTLKSYDDIFLVKYDPSGTVLWAKSAGGTANDIGASVTVDHYGNSYLTGYFASTSMTMGTTVLTNSASTYAMYVAEYDPSGTEIWAKSTPSTGDDRGNSIAVDILGNSYITGSFTTASLAFGSSTLTNAGGSDMYVAKLLTNTLGIHEADKSSVTMTVYPNPSTGVFALQLKGLPNSFSEAHISVVDMLGREVYSSLLNMQNTSHVVDLSGQTNGLYFVIVGNNNEQFSTRVFLNK
ncbi:MAG TPA: SBBP repeat-containing protein [Bacteroidia bacterium]|jgi:hypothetical protein|nr:SBBP repeat-containing protein [Bacteroidia bacterium]